MQGKIEERVVERRAGKRGRGEGVARAHYGADVQHAT